MEKEKFDEIMTELRSAKEELKNDREALAAEKRAYEQEKAAQAENPAQKRANEISAAVREVANAMMEKRAITLGGTGSVLVVSELFKALQTRHDFLSKFRYFQGANSNTVIPVLNPRPARPARVAEGVTNASSDSTAVLTATELKPETYFSELPVSFETLKYSAADIEAQLPTIFAEAFADAMANQIINGKGKTTYYEFGGLFTSVPSGNKIECAASGAPTIADLVKLALTMRDKTMVNPAIFISPTLYAGITTASVSGYDVYRNELIMNHTVEGVEVIVTGYAPSTTTANSIVAVGTDLKNVAIGVAADITIEPIKAKGDTNTYFQAVMGMDGKPIIADNVFGLKAISG